MEDKFSKNERPERKEHKERSYQRKERTDIVFGIRAVLEAIHAGRELNKILIQKGINKALFEELREALTGKNYFLQYVPNQKLDSLTEGNHQGVIAMVPPIAYQEIEPLIDKWLEEGKKTKCIGFGPHYRRPQFWCNYPQRRMYGHRRRTYSEQRIRIGHLRCHESIGRCAQPHSDL